MIARHDPCGLCGYEYIGESYPAMDADEKRHKETCPPYYRWTTLHDKEGRPTSREVFRAIRAVAIIDGDGGFTIQEPDATWRTNQLVVGISTKPEAHHQARLIAELAARGLSALTPPEAFAILESLRRLGVPNV